MKKELKIPNFDLSLDECKMILNNITGLVVISNDGKVRYLSQDMVTRIQRVGQAQQGEVLIGKDIEVIHPMTKIRQALEDGGKEQVVFYLGGGVANIARVKPLMLDGKVKGAVDYDLFFGDVELKEFFDKLVQLSLNGILNLSDSIEQIVKKAELSGAPKYTISDMVGTSPQMRELKQIIYNVADTDSTVLITGETGSGKELVAHSIHYLSTRQLPKIIEVNCAAIPDSLVESELFGYDEGSFTGAKKGGKAGSFEMANGGTIFLDEIDQLPYHIQPKLLRVLQEKEVYRIGGSKIPINVRVIAATNKDLRSLIEKGQFREDLFYRLNVINIKIPPLRDRKMDIPLLTEVHLSRLNKQVGKRVKNVSDEVHEMLLRHDWPGNVRELFNALERGFSMCKGSTMELEHLQSFFFETIKATNAITNRTLKDIRNEAEREAIIQALEICKWNKSKTAILLGITRPNLYQMIERYGIERV